MVAHKRQFTRQELVGRVRRAKAEIAQYLTDVETWNENNPGHQIDPGEAELLAEADRLDGLLRDLVPR